MQVGAERGLAVGACRYEVEPSARIEQAGAEAGYEVSAFVFEGHGWHRDEGIVGQERDERVEIGGLIGGDELRHDRVFLG